MKTTTKGLATATIAATALAGISFAVTPAANASAAANKTFHTNVKPTCKVGSFGNHVLPSVVSGTVPTSVKRGAAFSMTGSNIKVTVPADLNQQAYTVGARFQKVTFKVVNVNNTNIAPSVKDTVTKDFTTGFVPVPANGTSSFLTKTVSVPLKGGTKAGTGTIKAGSVTSTFTLYDANKNVLLANQPVSCGATNTPLVAIKIT